MPLAEASLDTERQLEDLICEDPTILSESWLLIGRQVATAYGKFIDLLAVDAEGSVIVIELKKHKTPREVVAQALDYGSWVKDLAPVDLANIFEAFNGGKESLNAAFHAKFGTTLDEGVLNSSHQLVIVASELDSSTERIVNYLSDSDIPINVIFFRVFADGEQRYLSRAWLLDLGETQEKAYTPKRDKEPWNGEFYVSFGHGTGRHWADARRYGFIAAGGKPWYSRTLYQLKLGDRVWVNVPRKGYVGVGKVTATPVGIQEFEVKTPDGMRPFLKAETEGDYSRCHIDDEDRNEYLVAIEWLHDVPLDDAVSEVGFFGNQNTVAKPTASKWVHTVDRLKTIWGVG